MNKVELLAPGGSMASIKAAVAAGADAVYAGGSMFGARAYADNPDGENILLAIDFCHLHGVKLYLTVNTLLKEKELTGQLSDYIAPVYERGVDAVLVQDLGVFHYLKKNFPDLPLHASTQMTIAGAGGAKLLQQMGAGRVVLSRELSLEDIHKIRKETDVELETFVHGALCYCYSGQCLMSSLIGGRSGNRGRCAQPCRLPYELYDAAGKRLRPAACKDGHYLLSLKDICTLQILPDLIDAGITSLKIEGRMKKPQYAAGVTAIYRKYIDLYRSKGRSGYKVDPGDLRDLTDLFSRGGFSEGYYKQKNGPSMMAMDRPDHSGTAAARVTDGRSPVRLTALEDLYEGDSLMIGGREYLMKEDVRAGKSFTARQAGTAARKDTVIMRVRAKHLTDTLSGRYTDRGPDRIPVGGRVRVKAGSPLKVTVWTDGDRPARAISSASGISAGQAERRPLTEEAVRKQMEKTGDTDFAFRELSIDIEGDCFVPVSEMNRVRREALDGLKKEILSGFLREKAPEAEDSGQISRSATAGADTVHPSVTASVMTYEQLAAVLDSDLPGGVYIDASMLVYPSSPSPESVIKRVHEAGKRAYLALPFVWRRETEAVFDRYLPEEKVCLFDGILLRSIDQFIRAKDLMPDGEVIADAGIYTWNREAQLQARALKATWDTCPYECTAGEMALRDNRASELVVYGRQPLMVTAQCLRKNTAGCAKQPSLLTLTDRKKISFPVRCECAFCMNTIYNSVPLDLVTSPDGRAAVRPGSVRYSFTTESGQEAGRILSGEFPEAITRGHIRKGVE